MKWPVLEADNSRLSTTEIKNGGNIPPLPYASSWHSDYIKHRNNFIFTFYISSTSARFSTKAEGEHAG
jgi:hypothetical protein